jgi:hypothetical protein
MEARDVPRKNFFLRFAQVPFATILEKSMGNGPPMAIGKNTENFGRGIEKSGVLFGHEDEGLACCSIACRSRTRFES